MTDVLLILVAVLLIGVLWRVWKPRDTSGVLTDLRGQVALLEPEKEARIRAEEQLTAEKRLLSRICG